LASGYSYSGGRSRCFAFWQEFSKCYAGADTPAECVAQAEDYLECLHHTKEIARTKAVREELMKRAQHDASERRKMEEIFRGGGASAGGLGIINKSKEDDKGSS